MQKKSIRNKIRQVWQENRFLMRPFLVLFAIYLLGISAILLAGVHYADDVARTEQGYAGWSGFSRYLSTILSYGLHADAYLTNIAPLPQLLAVAIVSVASLMVICVVSGKEVFQEKWTKWILRVIAVVPLGLCPYILECLSYQYDSVYMALSIMFAVMPLLFRKCRVGYVLATTIGILVVCMTYQASIGIYPILVIMVAMKEWASKKKTNWKELGKFVGLSVLSFALTVLVFKVFLMTPREVYASNAVPGIGEFFPAFFAHLGQYFELVISDFRLMWLVLMGVVAIIFIVVFTMASKQNKIVSGLIGIIGMIMMAVMAYAMYSALEKPLYTTRAMYAIGAWVAVMSVYIVTKITIPTSNWHRCGAWRALMAAPIVLLSWCWFVFGFTYGNALAEQNEYRDNQVAMVMNDLNKILVNLGNGSKIIQVDGQIGWAPAIKNTPEERYRILRRLLKPSFGTDVPWMGFEITLGTGIEGLVFNENVDLNQRDLPLIEETALYNIYGDKTGVLVKFKGEEFGLEF